MAEPQRRHAPLVEWVAGLLSLLIVLATVGYLVFETFQPEPGEPMLTLTAAPARQADQSFVVQVEIRNGSRAAAADVFLAGLARTPDGREARPLAHVDYVPGLSTRYASLIFEVDPGAAPHVRVVGYSKP